MLQYNDLICNMKIKTKIEFALAALVFGSVGLAVLALFAVILIYQGLEFRNTSKEIIFESCLERQIESEDFSAGVEECKELISDLPF